jgi:hypothetical protein
MPFDHSCGTHAVSEGMSAGHSGLGAAEAGPTFGYVHVSLLSRRAGRQAPESLRLARSIESVVVEAWQRAHAAWSATTALCDEHSRSAVREATPELSALVEALRRSSAADAEALCLCRNLLCDGFSSPLYAGRTDDLRREAGRLRYLVLSSHDGG